MSFKSPIPQGQHINKPVVLLLAVGLFVCLMVVFNFSHSTINDSSSNEEETITRSRRGQAVFLNTIPDSVGFQELPEAGKIEDEVRGENLSYVPPPPEELFPEKSGPVINPVSESRRPERARAVGDDQYQVFREAQESTGVIYDASENQGQSSGIEFDYSNPTGRGDGGRLNPNDQISGDFITPETPYTLLEGHLIPATLETAINSDLPGDIRAFVTRDIYDSIQMKHLLIPAGTRLVGSYDERVVLNQEKLLMSWDRMIFPDGRSIYLPNLSSYDLEGTSGLSGKVNTHFWKIFGQSAFISMIGVGASVAAPQQQGIYQQQTVTTQAAEQVAQDFNRVSTRVLDRNLQMAPTIEIPGGRQFQIFLAGDISFQKSYTYSPPTE